jgi:hypothetical protein
MVNRVGMKVVALPVSSHPGKCAYRAKEILIYYLNLD